MFEGDRLDSVRRLSSGRRGAIDAWRFGACLLFAALLAGETRALGPHGLSAVAGGMAVLFAAGGIALVVMATRWSRRWPVGRTSTIGAIATRQVLYRG